METACYLDKFQKSIDQLDQKLFNQKQLELKVGVWLNSAVLKIQKRSWLGDPQTAKPFEGSVFFSTWVNDELIKANKLYYNIHALKLRELTGYAIKSRDFAEAFRARFKPFEKNWPNVSLNFGPLTLMEGWVNIDADDFEGAVASLAVHFLEIAFIIDDLLAERKKQLTA
jgi:hypothetical protein